MLVETGKRIASNIAKLTLLGAVDWSASVGNALTAKPGLFYEPLKPSPA